MVFTLFLVSRRGPGREQLASWRPFNRDGLTYHQHSFKVAHGANIGQHTAKTGPLCLLNVALEILEALTLRQVPGSGIQHSRDSHLLHEAKIEKGKPWRPQVEDFPVEWPLGPRPGGMPPPLGVPMQLRMSQTSRCAAGNKEQWKILRLRMRAAVGKILGENAQSQGQRSPKPKIGPT